MIGNYAHCNICILILTILMIGYFRNFLNDILEAQETGKSLWWRWHERFGSYFQDKFRDDRISSGESWKERQVIKWEKYF